MRWSDVSLGFFGLHWKATPYVLSGAKNAVKTVFCLCKFLFVLWKKYNWSKNSRVSPLFCCLAFASGRLWIRQDLFRKDKKPQRAQFKKSSRDHSLMIFLWSGRKSNFLKKFSLVVLSKTYPTKPLRWWLKTKWAVIVVAGEDLSPHGNHHRQRSTVQK